MTWRNLSEGLTSKGAISKRATSLADLHRRRRETGAQFFTPAWVARGIWQALGPVVEFANQVQRPLSVIDNACGSGRLYEGAPANAALYGIDTDEACIKALSDDADAADIVHEFHSGSMGEADLAGFDVAVINPPFSIVLESPNLFPYECTNFGKYGPCTHALSHEYALMQALSAAKFVAAVLPASMDTFCKGIDSLLMKVTLPLSTFAEESAKVSTAVYFFGPGERVADVEIQPGQAWPALEVARLFPSQRPRMKFSNMVYGEKTIHQPVTGNKRVELHHHLRRIVLKYHCGLVKARVANAILRERAKADRLPKSVRYSGEGVLLLDVLLLQESPTEAFNQLLKIISDAGGEPWVSPTLYGYFTKLIRRHQRAITPFRRSIKEACENTYQVTAKARTLLSVGDFSAPSVAKGQVLTATLEDGAYFIRYENNLYQFRRDELEKRFEVSSNDSQVVWRVKHEGLARTFPDLAHAWEKQIKAKEINWLANFQRESLLEGLISPYGYIGGWEQGSGKARYAIALAMLQSGNNLIVVESGLLPEMKRELHKLQIKNTDWQVITNGTTSLRKVNLVTYSTLRQGYRVTRRGHDITIRTCAHNWRRQFNVVICDEGSLLSNPTTQQSRAVRQLAGRKVIVLDGTPQRNYARDLLPLAAITAGNGVAHQPFGIKGKPYLESRLFLSMNHCERGEDHFFDKHVITQWVTWEFRDEMTRGAKREVPKINNLPAFRAWLAPILQRRIRSEPELAVFNNCPAPDRTVLTATWDGEHLKHYLKVAVEFAEFYKRLKRDTTKAINLVTLLARISAVQRAANAPHMEGESVIRPYMPVTSKQRSAVKRIKLWVSRGRKVILYAKNPAVLRRLHDMLKDEQIDSVLFTGEQDIGKRNIELDSRFRFGGVQVLLSSWVGQRGLNLEQASVAILYERDWSNVTEEQAIARMLRPTQTQQVHVEYLHLRGSIDDYCAQLVEWKAAAADAGLDYGQQAGDEEEFLHLDKILDQFCKDLLGLSYYEAHRAYCG